MADTDTSTPCVGVTVTYIIMPGRSGERSYFKQLVAHSIQGSTCRPLATQTCALSQFYDWLIRRNVSMTDSCYHCLLVGEGGPASYVAGCQYCASWCQCHGEAGIRLQSSSLQPSPVSWIIWRSRAQRATRTAGDRRECPLICCLMRPVNSSCWTCSDARNIGLYNSSRYDLKRYTQYRFRFDTDLIIVRSLTSTPHPLDTIIAQALGQVNADVNLNTAAVDIDIVASYTTSLLFWNHV